MTSREAARASWTASRAAFLEEVGRVASFLEDSLAARAASSADALVSDMVLVSAHWHGGGVSVIEAIPGLAFVILRICRIGG